MKAKLSYKSKRNIIISVVIVALLVAIGTGTYFFTQGNDDAQAFAQNDIQASEVTEQNSETEEQGSENQAMQDSEENQEGEENFEQTVEEDILEGTTTSTNTDTTEGTTGTTTGDVPNEEYVTERIEEEEVLVSKDYLVEWAPLSLKADTTTSELGIIRPIIVAEKSTENKEVVAGEAIEYIITVSNIGNLEGTAIVQDKVPEKTTFQEGSIKINNVEAKHEDGSSYTEAELETGIEISVKPEEVIIVSFVVIVNEKETITEEGEILEIPTEGTVINTAIVNEEETNTVKNPILHTEKKSEVYRNDKKEEVAKVGDTIKYTIIVTNTSEELDVTTGIVDRVPEGTSLVKDSVSEGGTLAEDGIISWDEIDLAKGETREVSFSVIVDEETTTSIKNIALAADMPTNEVENPVINVEAVKISKADNPLYEKGIIEYIITLTNKGNAEGKVTVTDNVPDGTILVADCILVNGKTSDNVTFEEDKNNLITWKDITVGAEDTVVLSFKVIVNVFNTDTKEIINNTATLDDKPINNTTDEALKVYIDVLGKKVWEDKNNERNTRPLEGISIQLKANGKVTETQIINKTGNEWDFEFRKLPKYDEQGKEITYTVDEVAVDGYAKSKEGYIITNSLPNIEVEKNIYNLNNGSEVDKNTAITVKKGDIVGYKITVKNTGDVDLKNVVITDKLSNNNKIYLTYQNAQKEANGTNTVANIDKLSINESKTYIVYYKVVDNDVKDANVNIDNTAKCVGYFTNGNGQDEKVEDTSDKVIVNVLKNPKITAIKERVGSGKVEPGDIITYKIIVKNEGNTNLTNVKLYDIMNDNPKGGSREVTITGLTVEGKNKAVPIKTKDVYNIGNLEIGQTAVITATYKVTENDMAETEKIITNTARAEGLTDGNVSVKSEESKVDVKTKVWKTDIDIKKTSQLIKVNLNSIVGKKTAEYGDKIKYTITATNAGRKEGSVVVKDYIPDGCKLVSYSSSDGTTNLTKTEYKSLKNATKTDKFSKKLTVDGLSSKTIYFTVTVTAKPGETVQNIATDGRDNSDVPEKGYEVEKVVSITTKDTIPVIENSNVVIVLDISKSMVWENMGNETRLAVAKRTVNNLLDKISLKSNGKGSAISIVAFWGHRTDVVSGKGYSTTLTCGGKDTIANTPNEKTALKTAVNGLTEQWGTVISGALLRTGDAVDNLIAANPKNKNIVIFIGDGEPVDDGEESKILTYADNIKNKTNNNGVKTNIYSIGFGVNLPILQSIASTPTQYASVSNIDSLNLVFTNIVEKESIGDPVLTASNGGMVELTGINTSKKVTINGTEKTIDKWGSKIKRNGTAYYVDLKKFDANASVTIVYYTN